MAGSDTTHRTVTREYAAATENEAALAPTAQSSWTIWELEAAVTVTDPGLLNAAEEIVRQVLAAVDHACSRFRADSELVALQPRMPSGVRVSPMFRLLLERALDAARMTDGAVDPTLGADLAALGHGPALTVSPGIRSVPVSPMHSSSNAVPDRVPGWSRLRLDADTLTVPVGLSLDLGASAKAVAADLAAAEVHRRLGCGVLVSLGGDLASAGPGPQDDQPDVAPGQWQVLVQDLPADPAQHISLAPGFAVATSSTQKRRWLHAGSQVHHILDPRFGLPAEAVWRSVTVAAPTCLEANAFSTAAIVRGFKALEWFRTEEVPARFVDSRGRVATTGGWPAENDLTAEGYNPAESSRPAKSSSREGLRHG